MIWYAFPARSCQDTYQTLGMEPSGTRKLEEYIGEYYRHRFCHEALDDHRPRSQTSQFLPWMVPESHNRLVVSWRDRRVFKKLTKAPSGWLQVVGYVWCMLPACPWPILPSEIHRASIGFPLASWIALRASMRLSPESWRRRRPAGQNCPKDIKRFDRFLLKISRSRWASCSQIGSNLLWGLRKIGRHGMKCFFCVSGRVWG